MNERTAIAGIVVLVIGIALLLGASKLYSTYFGYPNYVPLNSSALGYFVATSVVVGILFVIAAIVLILYGWISPAPPVHWDNDL